MKFRTKKMIRAVSSQGKKGLLWGALLGALVAILMLRFADFMFFSLLGSIVVIFAASFLGAAVGGLIGTSIAVDEVEPISDEF